MAKQCSPDMLSSKKQIAPMDAVRKWDRRAPFGTNLATLSPPKIKHWQHLQTWQKRSNIGNKSQILATQSREANKNTKGATKNINCAKQKLGHSPNPNWGFGIPRIFLKPFLKRGRLRNSDTDSSGARTSGMGDATVAKAASPTPTRDRKSMSCHRFWACESFFGFPVGFLWVSRQCRVCRPWKNLGVPACLFDNTTLWLGNQRELFFGVGSLSS